MEKFKKGDKVKIKPEYREDNEYRALVGEVLEYYTPKTKYPHLFKPEYRNDCLVKFPNGKVEPYSDHELSIVNTQTMRETLIGSLEALIKEQRETAIHSNPDKETIGKLQDIVNALKLMLPLK